MVSKRATLAGPPEHSSSPGTLSLDGTQVGNFSRGALSGVFVSNSAGLPQTGLQPPASLPDLSVFWAVHEGEVLHSTCHSPSYFTSCRASVLGSCQKALVDFKYHYLLFSCTLAMGSTASSLFLCCILNWPLIFILFEISYEYE